jgi:hypothetical protein
LKKGLPELAREDRIEAIAYQALFAALAESSDYGHGLSLAYLGLKRAASLVEFLIAERQDHPQVSACHMREMRKWLGMPPIPDAEGTK